MNQKITTVICTAINVRIQRRDAFQPLMIFIKTTKTVECLDHEPNKKIDLKNIFCYF